MAKYSLLTIIVLCTIACKQKEDQISKKPADKKATFKHYELHGKIKGLKSSYVRLIKFPGDTIELVDIPVINETFNYIDSFIEPYLVNINTAGELHELHQGDSYFTNIGSHKLAELLLQPGIINISGTAAKYDSIQVDAGSSNKVIKQYLKEDEQLAISWATLKASYDSIKKNPPVSQHKQLAADLNKIAEQRIILLKNYVKQNSNSMTGALLPNFCMLHSVLKKEDYLEMYNVLSADIQKSYYGQSVLGNSK